MHIVNNTYATLSDSEWVERLPMTPPDSKLQEYFFNVKCAPMIRYISRSIFHADDKAYIMGEFYEFVSENNWSILKKWKNKENASLFSYLSRCATNYFMNKAIAEQRRQSIEVLPTTPEIVAYTSQLYDDETCEQLPVWQAFNKLSERNQAILRLLVIEDNQVMAVADKLWKYIGSKSDYSQLSEKRIQGTISMAKQRAQLALMEELKTLTAN
ncbi:MAG: sigma-70 family RNA polymerase sigma factor [Bacteroidaceae bacterium]|nr:sigma-70 family RNA polymerase sigma factor [Bacteroidaceae bacterium]